jgi:hypothetical protein
VEKDVAILPPRTSLIELVLDPLTLLHLLLTVHDVTPLT